MLALNNALKRYKALLGVPCPIQPRLNIIPDVDFWAYAAPVDSKPVITISRGVVPVLEAFWRDVLSERASSGGDDLGDYATMSQTSLIWLLFHEISHFELNHFSMTGLRYLGETSSAAGFAIASLGQPISGPIDQVSKADRPKVEPCLELQADHDAIELVIGRYTGNGWAQLRSNIAAISAVMMLIEREDSKLTGKPSGSHPKAATRIFQLLGHVSIMPFIPAQRKAAAKGTRDIDPSDLPPQSEIDAFKQKVTLPAFQDAIDLARIAGSTSIAQDLGTSEAFFKDVSIAHLLDVAAFDTMQTIGAKEWAKLVLFNEELKSLLGWREDWNPSIREDE